MSADPGSVPAMMALSSSVDPEPADEVGASLTGVMSSSNVSDALSVPSLAVTFTLSEPLKSGGGVPENVRVRPSNSNQTGSGSPLSSVAV